ncbi:MAG: S8 family serine peptidase, partial [Bacteroidota bacterium]
MEKFQVCEESRVLDLNLNPNQFNLLHHFYPQYDGRGMTISLREYGIDSTDLDLLGRLAASPNADSILSRHATNMASIMGGAGNSSPKGAGVAPKLMIRSSAFGDLLPDNDDEYNGVYVQNHAYGTEIENFYGGIAEAYDAHSYANPALLHLFSAGNRGRDTSRFGPYAGIPSFANLTGNVKHAKNVLTVGAIDSLKQILDYASRGPAYDGRIKPEVVAYSQDGTSNAVSLVSGLSVLLQQA